MPASRSPSSVVPRTRADGVRPRRGRGLGGADRGLDGRRLDKADIREGRRAGTTSPGVHMRLRRPVLVPLTAAALATGRPDRRRRQPGRAGARPAGRIHRRVQRAGARRRAAVPDLSVRERSRTRSTSNSPPTPGWSARRTTRAQGRDRRPAALVRADSARVDVLRLHVHARAHQRRHDRARARFHAANIERCRVGRDRLRGHRRRLQRAVAVRRRHRTRRVRQLRHDAGLRDARPPGHQREGQDRARALRRACSAA